MMDGGKRRGGAAVWGGREVLIPTCFSSIPVCEITEAPVNRFTVKYYVPVVDEDTGPYERSLRLGGWAGADKVVYNIP